MMIWTYVPDLGCKADMLKNELGGCVYVKGI